MPGSGRRRGRAFSAISEPPGRSGASHSSQARHRTKSAASAAKAASRTFLRAKLQGDLRETLALRDAQLALVVGDRKIVADAGEVAGAVRRAAGSRGVEAGL